MNCAWTVEQGDNLALLRALPDASVDAIVCDPPYGFGNKQPGLAELRAYLDGADLDTAGDFMGKDWAIPTIAQWRECLRVLKPGGHMLAFAGPRTQDLVAMGIRAAGFEVRDSLHWIYGSGFPKSLDVSKAIDKAAGAERGVVGVDVKRAAKQTAKFDTNALGDFAGSRGVVGFGTALKPAHEPIVVARKPLVGTVANNVLTHGTGALNIDACRVWTEENLNGVAYCGDGARDTLFGLGNSGREYEQPPGRWPPNVLFSGDEAIAELGRQSGETRNGGQNATSRHGEARAQGVAFSAMKEDGPPSRFSGDTGTAARFFPCFKYQAKAARTEREAGCDALPSTPNGRRNTHPTCKPIAVMRWLCRLVTPPGGLVLDPWCGSGSTGCAAVLEGFRFMGMERESEYVAIARARVAHWAKQATGEQLELAS